MPLTDPINVPSQTDPVNPTEPAPSTAPQPSFAPSEYRYTAADGVDEWMIGKTPKEVAAQARHLVTAASQPSFGPPATPVDNNSYRPQQHQGPQQPDPQLMFSDPAAYQQQLFAFQNAMMQAQIQQAAIPLMQQTASNTLSNAKRGRYADVWKRYEPEIVAELQGLHPSQYNEQILDKAAEIVQGKHWRDFVNEEVERRGVSSGMGTERAGGGSNAPGASNPADKLEEAWNSDHPYFERARTQFRSISDFRAMVRDTLRMPINQFVENVMKQDIISTGRGFSREGAR